jgi:undecaprenyl-diphosphatase
VSRLGWLRLSLVCVMLFIVVTTPIAFGRDWPGEWSLVQLALDMRSPFWTGAMQMVTFFGSSAVGLGLAVGMSAALALHDRHLTRQAWLPIATMLGSAPINFGLRFACGRLRPGVSYIPHRLPELAHPFQRWSYPSGHAMTATICYGLLAYLLVRASPKWRWTIVGFLALWLLVIGLSRVYVGVHWPTDILGGYLAGGSWLSVCIAVLGRRHE